MADFSDLCYVAVTRWEIIYNLLNCIGQFIVACYFYLFKDYSFSHSLTAIFFLYHHGVSNVGRYLVTVASVCLSVCLSVTLF